jgi:hypothetical protein
LIVLDVDENTETIKIQVTVNTIDFEAVQSVINDLGGSLHSIDEVEVQSELDSD